MTSFNKSKTNTNDASPSRKLINTKQLSEKIGLCETTIRTYTGNAKKWGHLIPPWFKLPGSDRLCWIESEVDSWIDAARAATAPPRKRGRPTKREQVLAGGAQ